MQPMQESDFLVAARRGDVQAVINGVASNPSLLSAKEPTNGWTALHLLARLSLALPVQQLLGLGADPEARDSAFRSALHLAASADASPALPPSTTTTASSASQPTPQARTQMQLATLRALLKGGARVTARDSFGMTPLHHAARAGHDEACHFLLSLNTEARAPRAPLEAETNVEERPLHVAAGGGHASTLRVLLQHGANPGKTNYLGQTALHLAAAAGDAADFLAAAGELVKPEWRANLSFAAADGSTPLHLAAAGGHTKMVQLLVRAREVRRNGGGRSVDLHAKDRRARTPADLARAAGFDDVATLLEEAARAARDKESRAEAEQEAALRRAFADARLDATREAAAAARDPSMLGDLARREGLDTLAQVESEPTDVM